MSQKNSSRATRESGSEILARQSLKDLVYMFVRYCTTFLARYRTESVNVYFRKYDFPRSLQDLGPLLAAIKKPSFDVKNVKYLTSKILLITSEAGF